MIYSRVPFVLCCECTHFIGNHLPHFLNSYPVLFHSSNTFLVSFPLSGCPSPLHHLVNSSHVHLKGHLHYEPFPDPPCTLSSLAPTSHSKQSVSASSAPLAPYLDFIITLCCHCWFPPLLNGKLFGVFSPLVYYSTLAHNRCSKNSQRRRNRGREGKKQNLSLLMAESQDNTCVLRGPRSILSFTAHIKYLKEPTAPLAYTPSWGTASKKMGTFFLDLPLLCLLRSQKQQ